MNLESIQGEIRKAGLFSIEPALYLPDFGVRTEVNLFVEERSARVTGEMQTEFVKL
jgi:Xaa-Pro dipeptidase